MYGVRVLSYDKSCHSKAFIDSINEMNFDDLSLLKSWCEHLTECFPDLIVEVLR